MLNLLVWNTWALDLLAFWQPKKEIQTRGWVETVEWRSEVTLVLELLCCSDPWLWLLLKPLLLRETWPWPPWLLWPWWLWLEWLWPWLLALAWLETAWPLRGSRSCPTWIREKQKQTLQTVQTLENDIESVSRNAHRKWQKDTKGLTWCETNAGAFCSALFSAAA